MKLIFAHDHKFKRNGASIFSNGSFPSSTWSRYTSIFNEILVIGRDGGLLTDESKGFTLSSSGNVQFKLLSNIANLASLIFGNKEVTHTAFQLVKEHDAVIARLPSRLGMLFIKEAIKQKKPYAVEVVGCPWDALWHYGNIKGKVFAPYAALELKAVLRKTNFAIYVTKEFLQKKYPPAKGATTIFCSNVEVPYVSGRILSNRLEKINSSNNRNVTSFGMIGNYSSKYKGIDIAINALAKADLPNWELSVLGNGDPSLYKALAKNLGVDKKVSFVGSLPSGKPVFEWLDSIDIYLHPSLTEGMPRALIEAMSRGCPALGSNVGGIPELLSADEMVKVADVDSFAKKIKRLDKDKAKQKLLANKNFGIAKNYYKDVLDTRRSEFWNTFRKSLENK